MGRGGGRGKKSNVVNELNKLIKKRASPEASKVFREWHNQKGSHRAQAITVCSLLEQDLEEAIGTHFTVDETQRIEFFGGAEGEGVTFATKINLAYALGVIEESIRAELHIIRRIRNAFAHTRDNVTFSTKQVAAACELLTLPKSVKSQLPLGREPKSAKDKFALSVQLLHLYFYADAAPRRFKTSSFYNVVFLKLPWPPPAPPPPTLPPGAEKMGGILGTILGLNPSPQTQPPLAAGLGPAPKSGGEQDRE